MAERSQFWPTGTTGDGTATINQGQTLEWFRDLFTPHAAAGPNPVQGILYGVLGNLQVTGTTTPVTVAAGAAVVEGFYYKNNAPLTFAIPPSSGIRVDLIVLRANWATRQVRLARLAGTEGSGIPSALTQVAGTTWEIAIAQISVLFGTLNVVNFADAFARPSGAISLRRQGGNATDWSALGVTNYTPPPWIMQTGVIVSVVTTLNITFPTPFAQPPIVLANNTLITGTTTTGFTGTTNTSNQVTQWLAIGPLVL